MVSEVKAPHERIAAAVQRIRAVIEKANPGPWFYNSYSGIFSGPMMRTYDEWFDAIPEDHRVERYGECPPCGDWREFPCGVAPSPGVGHGCRYFAQDYDRDPGIARVPSAHGDTAVRKRVGDAQHIELWDPVTAELVAQLLEATGAHWAMRPIGQRGVFDSTPLAALVRHINGEEETP